MKKIIALFLLIAPAVSALEGVARPVFNPASELQSINIVPICPQGSYVSVSGTRFVCASQFRFIRLDALAPAGRQFIVDINLCDGTHTVVGNQYQGTLNVQVSGRAGSQSQIVVLNASNQSLIPLPSGRVFDPTTQATIQVRRAANGCPIVNLNSIDPEGANTNDGYTLQAGALLITQ